MLKRAFKKLQYGILLLKIAGAKGFFRELKRQIYSSTTYVGVELKLDKEIVPVQSKIEYSLRLASKEDMEEIFQKIKTESKKSALELVQRMEFYESGFQNCYVARAAETNEVCYFIWMLTTKDNNLINRGFKSRFPVLKEDEVILENRYTIEKYRGNRLAPSIDQQLLQMAQRNGAKRMIGYVDKANIASMKASKTTSHNPFEEVRVRKLFFFGKREKMAIEPVAHTVSDDST